MANNSKADCFARIVAVLALIVSIVLPLGLELGLECWRIERKKPSLEANTSECSPQGKRPGPTNIALFNPGEQEALVIGIDFVIVRRFETPKEEPKVGAIPVEPIVLHASDYNEKNRRFSIRLWRPIDISGGHNVVLQMSIVEPRWSGFSYVGNVLVHYDRGDPLFISDVTLDVLPDEPNDG